MHNIKNTVSVAGIALDNEAGPSRDKGKGVDPRNWGDLEFSGEEFDPDIQQQILEECHRDNRKKVRHASSSGVAQPQVNIHSDSENSDRDFSPKHGSKKKNKKRAKRSKSSTKSKDSSNRELDDMIEQVTSRASHHKKAAKSYRNGFKPMASVAEDSALGQAFNNLQDDEDSSDSDSSSSSSSSTSSSSSSSGSSSSSSSDSDSSDDSSSDSDDESSSSLSSSEGSHHRGRKRRARKSKKSKRKASKRRKRARYHKSLIKPTAPAKYGGNADMNEFHQFMSHCTSYVKYGYVERERQVLV
ncbi:hypothetical protein H0H93_014125, partial [Arthromyces matolae]